MLEKNNPQLYKFDTCLSFPFEEKETALRCADFVEVVGEGGRGIIPCNCLLNDLQHFNMRGTLNRPFGVAHISRLTCLWRKEKVQT